MNTRWRNYITYSAKTWLFLFKGGQRLPFFYADIFSAPSPQCLFCYAPKALWEGISLALLI